jgi:hypothetical protein
MNSLRVGFDTDKRTATRRENAFVYSTMGNPSTRAAAVNASPTSQSLTRLPEGPGPGKRNLACSGGSISGHFVADSFMITKYPKGAVFKQFSNNSP